MKPTQSNRLLRMTESQKGAALFSWFVSTTRVLGQEVDWLLTPQVSEEAAKAFASRALARGLRVEAGTLPGIEPKVRIGWRAAHPWAQSSNANAIMGLRAQVAAAFQEPGTENLRLTS
jgi:hypothetical protein